MTSAYLDSKTGHRSVKGRSHFHFVGNKNELQCPCVELKNISIHCERVEEWKPRNIDSCMILTVDEWVDILLRGHMS